MNLECRGVSEADSEHPDLITRRGCLPARMLALLLMLVWLPARGAFAQANFGTALNGVNAIFDLLEEVDTAVGAHASTSLAGAQLRLFRALTDSTDLNTVVPGGLTGQLSGLVTDVDAVALDVAELASEVGDLETLLAALDTDLGTVDQLLGALGADLDGLGGSLVQKVRGQLGLQQADLDLLEDVLFRQELQDGFDQMRDLLQEKRDLVMDATNFEDSGACGDFRSVLTTLFADLGSVNRAVPQLHPDQPRLAAAVDGTVLETLIDAIPCLILYPLNVAFEAAGLATTSAQGEGTTAWLSELVDAVDDLKSLYEGELGGLDLLSGGEPQGYLAGHSAGTTHIRTCEEVVDDQQRIRRRSFTLLGAHSVLKVAAQILDPDDVIVSPRDAAPKPSFGGKFLAWHGYPGQSIQKPKNLRFVLSKALSGTADFLHALGNYGYTRVRHCQVTEAISANKLDLVTLNTRLGEPTGSHSLTSLVSDVRSRLGASPSGHTVQSQLDSIQSDLAELDPLDDATMLQRIDEVDDRLFQHTSDFDDWSNLQRRIAIEKALGGDLSEPVGLLQRPMAYGGMLELVRQIVEETIHDTDASGQPIYGAYDFFDRAERFFTRREYKLALNYYTRAYQEATRR